MLICARLTKISTLKYKRCYKLANGFQMLSSAILLVMQGLVYNCTIIELIKESVVTDPFSIFFLSIAEVYVVSLATCLLIQIGEILEWTCNGCKFKEDADY